MDTSIIDEQDDGIFLNDVAFGDWFKIRDKVFMRVCKFDPRIVLKVEDLKDYQTLVLKIPEGIISLMSVGTKVVPLECRGKLELFIVR